MRTTITIAPDIQSELERLRREAGMGPSEALNFLARKGLAASTEPQRRYEHKSVPLGMKLDVSNVAEVLELLDREDRT